VVNVTDSHGHILGFRDLFTDINGDVKYKPATLFFEDYHGFGHVTSNNFCKFIK
jgi:hypothetical protein